MKNEINAKNARKVAIYVRVSTHWQVDKDSLQVQKRELVAYSEMLLGIPDYEIFEDPGYSAKNTDRPAFQAMMFRLRTGEFSHLLVWKIDRISRNLLDFATMYTELKSYGVTFVSKNEQFDTSNAIGEAMLKIILVFAELERNMTAERVTAVMLSRAGNGQFNGGRIPYGYDYSKETREFTVNPQESAVYESIVEMYEQSHSLLYVVRTLNGKGIKTHRGNAWSATTVHKLLTNVFYLGTYRYNTHDESSEYRKRPSEEWIEIRDHHPALIDEQRFNAIQKYLHANQRKKPGKANVSKHTHVFAGLIICGVCGAVMTASLDKPRSDGYRPSVYLCPTRRKHSDRCDNKYISESTVGPFVFRLIGNIIRAQTVPKALVEKEVMRGAELAGVRQVRGLDRLADALSSDPTGYEYSPASVFTQESETGSYETLTARRNKLETALTRLHSMYLFSETMTESEYRTQEASLQADISDIEKQLAELETYSTAESETSYALAMQSFETMAAMLADGRKFDYDKFIRTADHKVPQDFMRLTVSSATVTYGRVTAVKLASGIELQFEY